MVTKLLGFLTKYMFRAVHLATFALIFGNITLDYYLDKRSSHLSADLRQTYIKIHIISSVALVVSGLVNMIILVKENKFKKDLAYNVWKSILMFKFFATLTLTPILERAVPNYLHKEDDIRKIRLTVVIGLFLVSPFLRYFREKFLSSSNDAEKKFA